MNLTKEQIKASIKHHSDCTKEDIWQYQNKKFPDGEPLLFFRCETCGASVMFKRKDVYGH